MAGDGGRKEGVSPLSLGWVMRGAGLLCSGVSHQAPGTRSTLASDGQRPWEKSIKHYPKVLIEFTRCRLNK